MTNTSSLFSVQLFLWPTQILLSAPQKKKDFGPQVADPCFNWIFRSKDKMVHFVNPNCHCHAARISDYICWKSVEYREKSILYDLIGINMQPIVYVVTLPAHFLLGLPAELR